MVMRNFSRRVLIRLTPIMDFIGNPLWHARCRWSVWDESPRIKKAERTEMSGPTQEDMNMIKVYGAMWLLTLLVAAVFVVTGNFGAHAMIGFGFAWFGLSFMGLMGVLPTWVGHQNHH